MPPRERGALVLGTLAGASAWISLGALAVTGDQIARVGVVPPLWALAAFIATAVLATWIARLETSQAWPLALTLLLWLPWLPMPIFSPLTVWEGPMEALVWIAAIAGVAVARFWPSPERMAWVSDRRKAPRILGGVMLAASLTAAVALSERIPAGDEPHYLIIAQSLLKDGDLRIQNNHDRGDYFAYFDNGLPPDFLKRGLDGQIYSIHAPGVAVLILPAFLIAGYPGSVILIAFLVAAGLAANWRSALHLAEDGASAWAGTLAVGLSATVLLHSFSIFPDPVGWAVVSAALALLVRLDVAPDGVRPWLVAMTGAVIGCLPWLHTRFAVIAGACGAVFAARLWARPDRWRMLGAFAAAPAVLAAAWFGYFWIIYGTFDPAAPYGTGQQSSLLWAGRGAVGLAFDQQFGLIANAPALALLPFGWVQLYRRKRRLAIEFLVLTVPYLLVVASFGMWWGGWSAPARFLDSILPIAVPLMALAWRDSNRAVRGVFIALVFIGIMNIVLRIVVLDGLLLYNQRDGYDLLLDWLSRAVNLPLAFPAVHRKGGLLALILASIWLAAGLVAITILSALLARGRGRGAQWALTGAVGVALATVALFGAWRVGRAVELTPQSSQIDFLRRWRPDLRPLAVGLPRLASLQTGSVLNRIELSSSRRAREANPDPTLFTVAWLPAGDYQVVIEGERELAGVLTASVGMTSQTIETWPLDGLTSGATAMQVSLPALAHSLVIRGDETASRRITRVWLRPLAIRSGVDRYGEYIIRASRYQDSRVFVLDDEVYMEPTGIWTRGNATARLALSSARPTVPIDLQAGPVPTTVRLVAGEWSQEAALAAGERRRVEVPSGGVLTVGAAGSFRPVDYEPASRDARALGVRLEFPPW
jgi:hypothetical protein